DEGNVVALNLDRSHGRRKYGELVELVRAVLDCDDPGAEDLAVEWKSTLDLTKPAGGFHVARGILGFANRTVHEAARQGLLHE
ncbi:hypothetical protein, partial [Brevibacterium sediminis]|uniref:hypothetical protein n=1 Tax=Brevibacterium sediminis TaxID=1857024 RepID=UPI003B3B5406